VNALVNNIGPDMIRQKFAFWTRPWTSCRGNHKHFSQTEFHCKNEIQDDHSKSL